MIDRALNIAFFVIIVILTILVIKRKTPAWGYLSEKLIGRLRETPPGFEVTYNGRVVGDAYRTWVIFFNGGYDTIRNTDISDKPTVHFEKAEILRPPEIIEANKQDTGFSLKQVNGNGESAVELDFQYLDHNDGAVIEVFHTKAEAITLSGHIIGTKAIQYVPNFTPVRPPNFVRQLAIAIAMLCVPEALLIWAAVTGNLTKPTPGAHPMPQIESIAIVSVMALLYCVAMTFTAIVPLIRHKRFPKWAVV